MPVSRSLARSRRHLSQRQENWFSMRPEGELRLDTLIDPDLSQKATQENNLRSEEIPHPAEF